MVDLSSGADESEEDDDAELQRVSSIAYPRALLEVRAALHTRFHRHPNREEARRQIYLNAQKIRVRVEEESKRAAEKELELDRAARREEKEASLAHKVINVGLSNALTLMKVEDKPSVVLVRRYGEKSWLVLFNVPRYKDRWGASQFRPAHVEMLSK